MRAPRRYSAAILAFFVLTSACNAENVFCPPQKPIIIPSAESKWEEEYFGFLKRVVVIRTFLRDGKVYGSQLQCVRDTGSAKMWITGKSCRLIEGGGESETPLQSRDGESVACTFKRMSFPKTNDTQCMISCS